MSNIPAVEAFVDTFNRRDLEAVMAFFAADAVYHNMPGPPVSGTDAIRNVIQSFISPSESIDWENLAIAEQDNKVLTERIDRFVIGGKKVELPVMGTFEFTGGKISAWRDYFDMATWQRQMNS